MISAGLRRRHIAAATIGNALEFYDFITYAFFAIQIGHAFFPAQSAYGSLMLSLATFGAGFVTRPIGGLVIGAYADRVGRRPAMMLSFTLMGAAIVALALIPSYAAIGIAAPILAILARMVQGFSLGGEVGPNTAYLLEAAPPEGAAWRSPGRAPASDGIRRRARRGRADRVMPPARSTPTAGASPSCWALPPCRSASGCAAACRKPWTRRSRPASPATAPTAARKARSSLRVIALGLVALSMAPSRAYVFIYITTYAQQTLHMAARVGFAAGIGGSGLSFSRCWPAAGCPTGSAGGG